MTSSLPLIAVTAVAGWVALFPARRALGAWAYFAVSWPVGLLAWPVSAAFCSILHLPVRLPWIVTPAVAYIAAVAYASALLSRTAPNRGTVPWWGFAAHLGAMTALTALVTKAAYYFATFDSWFGYDAPGMRLFDNGSMDGTIGGSRNLLLPAMHAVNRAFGGDFLVTAYAVLSLHVVLLLLVGLTRFSFAKLRRPYALAASGVIVLGMVTGNLYVFHSLYVHSHMTTATFLLMAVLAVGAAASDKTRAMPWLLVGGLGVAGVALARPDGPAYALAPVVLAIAAYLEGEHDPERLVAFFAPLLALLGLAFAAMWVRLGMWQGEKLTGTGAAAVLLLMMALPLAAWLLARDRRTGPWLSRPGRVRTIAVSASVAVVVVAFVWKFSNFVLSLRNMAANLMLKGGWGTFWMFAFSALLLTLLFPAIRRRGAISAEAGYVLAQFACIALVVHGINHPGRLGLPDSFNRIVFHVVPLVWLYLASFAGAALAGLGIPALLAVDDGAGEGASRSRETSGA
jgi:hypothetical protein